MDLGILLSLHRIEIFKNFNRKTSILTKEVDNDTIILLDETQYHYLRMTGKTYVSISFDWRITWDKKSTPRKCEKPYLWLFKYFSPKRVNCF